MKSICALCAVAIPFLTLGQTSVQSFKQAVRLTVPQGPKNEILAGQVRIKLKPVKGGPAPIPVSVKGLPAGSTFLSSLNHMGWTLWSIPKNSDPRKVALAVRSDRAVAYAEPVNRVYLLVPDPNDYDYGVVETAATNPDVVLDLNDVNPSFTRLWYLDETFARSAWD
ncbi:MAG: hypothetical protein ACHQ50_11155, partial [Fimbriimonadales bacterium]